MNSAAKNSSAGKPAVSAFAENQGGVQNDFPIVGVGASAGGLEAFTQLLTHLPADTGMAFVLVQHLDPDHPSQLASLLAKATAMPVREVKDGMDIAPNHVYVIPPNANLNLSRGRLKLTPRGEERISHSVNHFFTSLAQEHENCAIGVVLSGTGSDGTKGLTEIKAAGGITFAQDEKTAKFSGMPAHAMLDSVDFILSPEKIAAELARIGKDPYVGLSQNLQTETAESDRTKDYRRVLALVRLNTGVDLTQYRDTTLKRRIQRRMVVRTRHTLPEYIELLEKDREEAVALFNDMLIDVTSFFRDAEMFETLKSKVFPEILKAHPRIIRIWVVACSTGQEAYSIAIALLEFLEQKSRAPGIQIFATDIREAPIEKGRRGHYTEGIEAEVSPERLRRFFTKEDGGYRISKTIRDLCVFARQNVTADPPFSHMDLVTCRNLLIYLTPPLQRHVVSTFHYALNPNGHLVLGNSETVGANSDLFEIMDRKHKIYSKKNAAIRPFSHFAAQDLKSKIGDGLRAPANASAPADFQKEADRILLGRYAPAGVLVNSNLEVLQFRGRTSPYLEPPTGEASFNLLKMARENLSLELGTAIREAKKKNAPVQRNVRLHDHDKIRRVNLEIMPVKLPGSAENCFLVLFDEAEKGRAALRPAKKESAEKEIPATEKNRELKRLRTELAAAREYLQAITEQQDVANEELKCANEEVLSSNEELQSTNEQLGTAKEELQSTNEELQTLNEELQTRNTELNQLNNDLGNLLAGVQIPILMLGNDLRVRRFNPAAVELFQLKPAVVGRPVHSIDSPIVNANLEKLLLEVIENVTPKEMEIRDRQGRWFSLRLHPYRTDNHIDGVILALVDIDALKRAQEKLLDYVNAIVDTTRSPLLVLNSDLRIRTANDAFYEKFRVSKDETEKNLIYKLGNGQWDIPELRRMLSEILSGQSVLKDFEVIHHFPAIGRRMMLLNARRLEQKSAATPMILLSIEDVTEWKQIEEVNRWLAAIVESSDDAIIGKDLTGKIISCNQGAAELFGYAPGELVGKSVAVLIAPDRPDEEPKIIARIQCGESVVHYETVRRKKDGSLINVSLTISPVKDLHGKIIGASSIARDITERKRAQHQLEESFQREKTARQTAETASRTKDNFLAALSHELRTPLNPVLLVASAMAEDPQVPEETRGHFEMIRRNVELEARLIDDLLDINRITRGKLSLEKRPLDAHAILQDAITIIESDMKAKKIGLTLKLAAKQHMVLADAVRLQQIFWNILKNAVKYTPEGGKIAIETRTHSKNGRLTVSITDTGIGLTPEEISQIFNAFTQGDHAGPGGSHRFGGLGLGLAISRMLAELHSGVIRAASNGRDQGATFTIELPCIQSDAGNIPPAPKKSSVAYNRKTAAKKK